MHTGRSNRSTTPALTETVGGVLYGYTERGVHTFRGVPYGRAERFKRAHPASWDGVRLALVWGENCPISANNTMGRLEFSNFSGSNLPQNEDCLFANIWTTSLDDSARLPIILFIHGGQFTTGSSNQIAYYEGRSLAASGEAVFISVNHRLNVLGYMDLSEFGDEYADSGNLGHFDLIDALAWVRANATAFGGDPHSITLVGQSGGGGKILSLTGMPAAAGLFHRAWLSSAATSWRSVETARAETRSTMERAGVRTAEELARLPYLDLLDAARSAGYAASPVFGSPALPAPVFELGTGSVRMANDVPLVVTSNLGEFDSNLMRMTSFIQDPSDPFADSCTPEMSPERVRHLMAERFGERADDIAGAFSAAYPNHPAADALFMDAGTFFGRTRHELLDAKAAAGGAPAFGGIIAKNLPAFGGVTPGHTWGDMPFLFANEDMIGRLTAGEDEAFARYAASLSGALLAFAKTGDPSTEELPWPRYDAEARTMMVFDDECAPREHHERELYRLFDEAGRGPAAEEAIR